MKPFNPLFLILILFFFGTNISINAQIDSNTEIYKILKTNDSLLFERSFNHCETQYLNQLIAEDFEFYHDQSGVNDSKETFIKTMQNGICNPNNSTKSRRELIEDSLEVFLLKNNDEIYGALQNGVHRFYETTNGKEIAGSIAKFSHLWVLENNQWQLKRVISYDHKNQNQAAYKKAKLSQSILNSYTGSYHGEHSGLILITQIENGLHMVAGKKEIDVYPTSQTLFFHEQAPLTFEFISSNTGEIEKFIVRENNKIVDNATKQ